MANQGVRGASQRWSAVVAGERQHASHALQVAMGTLFILHLHLPRDKHRTSASPSAVAVRSEAFDRLTCAGASRWDPGSPPTDATLRRLLASSRSRSRSRRSAISSISSSCASLLLSSRCFMSTATTTLTRTNWAVSTNVTKYTGEMTDR